MVASSENCHQFHAYSGQRIQIHSKFDIMLCQSLHLLAGNPFCIRIKFYLNNPPAVMC